MWCGASPYTFSCRHSECWRHVRLPIYKSAKWFRHIRTHTITHKSHTRTHPWYLSQHDVFRNIISASANVFAACTEHECECLIARTKFHVSRRSRPKNPVKRYWHKNVCKGKCAHPAINEHTSCQAHRLHRFKPPTHRISTHHLSKHLYMSGNLMYSNIAAQLFYMPLYFLWFLIRVIQKCIMLIILYRFVYFYFVALWAWFIQRFIKWLIQTICFCV